MAQQTINVGTAPNDGTGTPLRTAFQYTNSNFSELYTAVGPSGNNIVVPGNATITGDLTVATDALKVNSSTKDICIGTTTPTFNNKLTVVGGAGGDAFITSGNGTRTGYIGTDGTNVIMGAYSNHPLRIHVNDYPQMEVAALGVFNWYDGAGGTRMTLNSTGLGVGTSPTTNCKLSINGGVFLDRGATGGASQLLAVLAASSGGNFGQISNTGTRWALGYGSTLTTVGTEALIWDSSGNVGIGVTPSAWSTYKAIQVGQIGAFWANPSGTDVYLSANQYFGSGSDRYIANGLATIYKQNAGVHSWLTAPSGTAGNAITFTQAMTLDGSGRLGVGVVPASNTRTHFKGSSTSTDYINYCVNSSDKLAFGIRNDGLMITGPSADSATLPNSPYNLTTGSAANVFVDSQGIFYRSTSSLKYKTDIADSTRGLADVLKLRPVTYKAKNSGDIVFGGLIAEEVDAAGLTEFVQYAPDNTPDAIHYGNMVSLLVAAIKELTARVQTLETR